MICSTLLVPHAHYNIFYIQLTLYVYMCHASVCYRIMAQLIVYLVFITYSKMILNRRYIGPNGMGITEGCVYVCVREKDLV